MTQQKISFAVEDATLIEENPNSSFSILSLDFFASGANRHDTFVSEETLFRTADTIKNCPVVWKYDSLLDDAYTHDKGESPCGFIPEKAEVKSRTLEDGRTMLSIISYVWKKFSGSILELFKRDGVKPISVEMSVFGTKDMDNGLTEILDYRFEAVTVLGSLVTPAIPGAMATVLSFATDYDKDYKKEFSSRYSDLDFSISKQIKNNASKALDKHKESNSKATSVDLAVARHLVKSDVTTHERIKQIHKKFSSGKNEDEIVYGMYGGNAGRKFAEVLYVQIQELDSKQLSYYSGDNFLEEKVNTGELIEDNLIMDNYIGTEMEVKNNMKIDEKEVDMAKPESEEKAEDEKAESAEEEKKEKEEGAEKKFSYAEIFGTQEEFAKLFAEEEDDDEDTKSKFAQAKEEFDFGVAPAVMMHAMFAKMVKIAKKLEKADADSKVYMAENEDLKSRFSEIEKGQKEFAVTAFLKELSEKVVIPEDKLLEFKTESDKFSFAEIDAWKNSCKAMSFDFKDKKPKDKEEDDITMYALPFINGVGSKVTDSPWPVSNN